MATNFAAITVFAILLGRMSDRLNRKSFVLGGMLSMVLAAVIGASAIEVSAARCPLLPGLCHVAGLARLPLACALSEAGCGGHGSTRPTSAFGAESCL